MNDLNDILISTIMCVFNTPVEYLKEAVRSILNQTHSNFELLIVDDCSDKYLFDDELFKDSRIKILKTNQNSGAACARNLALSVAKGKYVAIMDSDDESFPNRFEKQLKFMEDHEDVVACGTWFRYFGAKTREVRRVFNNNDYYRCCLLFGNTPTLLNPSVMIRRSILIENNIKYDERLRLGQDYGMWVDLSTCGTITNLNEILINYRVHENQVTFENHKKKQTLKYVALVKRKQLERMNAVLSEDDMHIFCDYDFIDRNVDPVNYAFVLSRILSSNENSHYFNQKELEKRTILQWNNKIKSINNPLLLIKCLFKIKDKRFKKVFKIKICQFFHKFFRKKDEYIE